MDRISKEQRSKLMSKIRSKNTKPELALMAMLDELDIRYEYQQKMMGNPDFLIDNLAVFVDGSFWHCNMPLVKYLRLPYFWKKKLLKNKARDVRTNFRLRAAGYSIVRIPAEILVR